MSHFALKTGATGVPKNTIHIIRNRCISLTLCTVASAVEHDSVRLRLFKHSSIVVTNGRSGTIFTTNIRHIAVEAHARRRGYSVRIERRNPLAGGKGLLRYMFFGPFHWRHLCVSFTTRVIR